MNLPTESPVNSSNNSADLPAFLNTEFASVLPDNSNKEAGVSEKRGEKEKLILILDLDHTLLDSTMMTDMSSEEKYLIHQAESMKSDAKRRSLFKLDRISFLAKLRPFVHTFLKEASSMFEMYIYTMAEHSYALEMANILDPDKAYFGSRVLSKADSTLPGQKGLDVVPGAESDIVILDDSEHVWLRHRENLIVMKRYYFFSAINRKLQLSFKSFSELKIDEKEKDGVLAHILNVLRRVHDIYLKTDVSSRRDVRQILRSIRKETLRGCKIVFVFNRAFQSGKQVDDQPIWRTAQQLGAICSTVLDSCVTHVVSANKNCEEARWAVMNGKFLVNHFWVETSNFYWKRQREENFKIISQF